MVSQININNHTGKVEEESIIRTEFLGFEVLTAVIIKSSLFWYIPLRSQLKVNWTLGGICRLYHQSRRIWEARNQNERSYQAEQLIFKMVSCLAYSSALKMDATCSSETSVYFQRTTRRYIPGDTNLLGKRLDAITRRLLWITSK
jgi:hypothetical protein